MGSIAHRPMRVADRTVQAGLFESGCLIDPGGLIDRVGLPGPGDLFDPARPVGCAAAGTWQVSIDPEDPGPSLTALSALLAAGIDPRHVRWSEPVRQDDLFAAPAADGGPVGLAQAAGAIQPPVTAEARARASLLALPDRFAALARLAAMHSDPARFTLLHRVATRQRHAPDEGGLQVLQRLQGPPGLQGPSGQDRQGHESDRLQLARLAREVRLEIHRVEAFTRFHWRTDGESRRRMAWIEPRHAVLREVAPFFAERFAGSRWTILSPRLSVDWDGHRLRYGPGVDPACVPPADADDARWLACHREVFRPPARPASRIAAGVLARQRTAISAASGTGR